MDYLSSHAAVRPKHIHAQTTAPRVYIPREGKAQKKGGSGD